MSRLADGDWLIEHVVGSDAWRISSETLGVAHVVPPWREMQVGIDMGWPPGAVVEFGGDFFENVLANAQWNFPPDTPNAGWRRVLAQGIAWEVGQYLYPGDIRSRGEATIYRAKSEHLAQVGWEPENPVMWAVWELVK